MGAYHIAQLNIGELAAPLESPQLAGFVDNLEAINALAERTPGYVWRLQTEDGDATALRPFGDDVIVNMSVWEDIDALFDYVYRSAHTPFLGRRKSWFKPMRDAFLVLWWVPVGHEPELDDALQRLAHLRAHGPSPFAFTFKRRFAPPAP